jgi:hypothetical protein
MSIGNRLIRQSLEASLITKAIQSKGNTHVFKDNKQEAARERRLKERQQTQNTGITCKHSWKRTTKYMRELFTVTKRNCTQGCQEQNPNASGNKER